MQLLIVAKYFLMILSPFFHNRLNGRIMYLLYNMMRGIQKDRVRNSFWVPIKMTFSKRLFFDLKFSSTLYNASDRKISAVVEFVKSRRRDTALKTVQYFERRATGRLQQLPQSGKFHFDPSWFFVTFFFKKKSKERLLKRKNLIISAVRFYIHTRIT